MNQITKWLFILSLAVAAPSLFAQNGNYQDYYNSIYAKQVKIQSIEDLQQTLVKNGLTEEKWISYVLRMNGLEHSDLQNLAIPISLYIPRSRETKPIIESVPATNQQKPKCILLTPQELAQRLKYRLAYKTYLDYVYSRKVLPRPNATIEDTLKADTFSYPNIKRWVNVTIRINKADPLQGSEIYLPPCHVTNNVAVVAAPVAPAPPAVAVKTSPASPPAVKQPRQKRHSYFAQSSLGYVRIQADDAIDSEFTLIFLKIGLGIQQMMNGYSLRGGLAMNNYLSVKWDSNVGSDEASGIPYYFDFFLGGSKIYGLHRLSLQYDNLNYLLNKNDKIEQLRVSLEPTRVDRLSIMDAYALNDQYSLIGSLAYFPDLFSKAHGLEFGLGVGRQVTKIFSLSAHYIQNSIEKDNIKNRSNVFMVGGLYRF